MSEAAVSPGGLTAELSMYLLRNSFAAPLDCGDDLADLGKAPRLGLGEDLPTVNRDDKNAAGTGDQLCFRPQFSLQMVSQTGGLR